MKKLIQIGTLLSLLILFGAGSTFAADRFGTEVNIPFAFNVGDRTYEAGQYVIKLEKLVNGTAALSIQNTKTDDVTRVLMNANGDTASDDVRLVFDTFNGQRYLTKLKTTDRTYAIVGSKPGKDSAKAQKDKAAEIGGGANIY